MFHLGELREILESTELSDNTIISVFNGEEYITFDYMALIDLEDPNKREVFASKHGVQSGNQSLGNFL